MYKEKKEKHKQTYGQKFYAIQIFINIIVFGIISFNDWYNAWGLGTAIVVNIIYTNIWARIHSKK